MWELLTLLLLVAVLVVVIAPRFVRPGPRGALASGTLLVTGVSPRPDETGEQWVTVSGVINGPTVNEYAVYRRMIADVDQWPTTGQQLPVVYSPNNPDNWNFATAPDPPGH